MMLSGIARGVCAELRGAHKGPRLARSLIGAWSALAIVVALGLSTAWVFAASTPSLSPNHSAGAGLRLVEAASKTKSPEAEKTEPGKQTETPPNSQRKKRGGPNSAPATEQPATPEGQNDLINVMRPKVQ